MLAIEHLSSWQAGSVYGLAHFSENLVVAVERTGDGNGSQFSLGIS